MDSLDLSNLNTERKTKACEELLRTKIEPILK